MEVDVSNMKTNRNKSNVKNKSAAENKLQVNLMRQKSQHEEIGSELNPDLAELMDFVENGKIADSQKPESERSAWH